MLTNPLSQANAGSIFGASHTFEAGRIVSFSPGGAMVPFPSDVTGSLISGVTLPGSQLFAQYGSLVYAQVVPTGDEDDQPHQAGTYLAAPTALAPGSEGIGRLMSLDQIEAISDAVAVLCACVQDAPPQFTASGKMLQLVQWLPQLGASVTYVTPP